MPSNIFSVRFVPLPSPVHGYHPWTEACNSPYSHDHLHINRRASLTTGVLQEPTLPNKVHRFDVLRGVFDCYLRANAQLTVLKRSVLAFQPKPSFGSTCLPRQRSLDLTGLFCNYICVRKFATCSSNVLNSDATLHPPTFPAKCSDP